MPGPARLDQGRITAITNSSGTVANSYSYDAYGNTTASSGSVSNQFKYAGEYQDAESLLYYLRARYYDPATQQFLTVDPLVGWTEQAYAYTGGSPTNYADPTGASPGGGISIFGWSLAFASAIGVVANVLLADWTTGRHPTSQQLFAAAFTGAFVGASGMLASFLGGTVAEVALGFLFESTPEGFIAYLASAAIGGSVAAALSGGAGWLGQNIENFLDPCHASDPVEAAKWSAFGGFVGGGLVPLPNVVGTLGKAIAYTAPNDALETIPQGLRVKAWLTAAAFVSTFFASSPQLSHLFDTKPLNSVFIPSSGPIFY